MLLTPAELRGEHDLIAATFENLAEEALASPASSVDLGGVEEGDARVDGGVHHEPRRLEVEATAEVVATEPDTRNTQATRAEIDELHAAGRYR